MLLNCNSNCSSHSSVSAMQSGQQQRQLLQRQPAQQVQQAA